MNKIINKIQLLLNKAKATDNQHEADAFMSKAQQYMNEHNLSFSEITSEENEVNEVPFPQRGWKKALLVGICKPLNIVCINGTSGFRLVGGKSDIEVCKFMFDFYVNSLNCLSEKYYNANPYGSKLSVKNSYCKGATRTLSLRLEKQNKDEVKNNNDLAALMHIKKDAVDRFLNDKYSKIKNKQIKSTYNHDAAFLNGLNDAKTIQTNSKQLI